MEKTSSEAFGRLYSIVARLRGPGGCPWDREQSPATIRGNIIEEAYELVEAINEKDSAHVREEVGDLFLLGTMVAYMHEEAGDFKVADALDTISEKLIRRHPHVFGDSDADTPQKVLEQWNEIKEKVEGRRRKDSLLDEVSKALPPLERAYKIQKKAAKVGFDWENAGDVWDKTLEELSEAKIAYVDMSRDELESELGDLLFSVINVARFLDVDPAVALHRTIEKFSARFRHVEKEMNGRGEAMSRQTAGLMNELWDEAKKIHR